MKKFLLLTIFILTTSSIFSQPEHIQKFFECGMPNLSDYKCFFKDTLHATNPLKLDTSKNYNKKHIPRRLRTKMKFMRTSAFLVVKDNEIVFEEYYRNFYST